MSLLSDNYQRGQIPTIVPVQAPTNCGSTRVSVFKQDEGQEKISLVDIVMAAGKRSTQREAIECVCTMLNTFCFGIMLGWPSSTYPVLLDPIYTTYPFDPLGNFTVPSDPDAPLEGPFMITLVQSPLIAGLLMLGVVLSTPFSSHAYTMHSIKHGLLVSLLAILIAWIILWQATNIFHLLVSRFLIGMANGYAIGQVKNFIQHAALTPKWKALMVKMINIMMLVGVLCAYIMGIWLDFEGFAIGAMVFTAVCYLLTFFLPFGVPGDQGEAENRPAETVWLLLRRARLRRSICLLVLLTFVQQFVGAPATIVYAQVLILNLGVPRSSAPYCALIYLLVYMAAYAVGTFYVCTLSYTRKRCILMCSIVGSMLALVLIICIIRFDLRESNLYVPLVGMCVYIVVYGLGLGTIPNTFVEHLFEVQWRRPASELQLMCFMLFALIITKLLQVFLGEFPLEFIFVLFLSVATAGLAFVLFCVSKKSQH